MQTKNLLRAGWLAAVFAVLLSGCAPVVDPGNGGGQGNKTVSSLTVAPTSVSLMVGDTQLLTVTAHYSDSTTAEVTDAVFASDAESVATVSTAGVVTGVGGGSATITVTEGGKSTTVAATITAPVVVSAPTSLFLDSGLTYVVGSATATTEKAKVSTWGSDTLTNTDNTTPLNAVFGSHPGWAGAVAFVERPGTSTGSYDLSGVTSIKFKIKSPDIAPANLTFLAQSTADGDQIATLADLGATDLTEWTQITVDVATLFGAHSTTDVHTAFALEWGSGPGDTTSVTSGSYDIGDIEFVDANGADVSFYSGIAQATAPSTLASAPSLASTDVISLYNSSATYTDITIGDWNPNWGQSGSISNATVSTGTVKLLNLVNYQGVDFSGNVQDITGKAHLHLSVWTHDGSKLNVYAVNVGDTNAGVLSTTIAHDTWVDVELDMTGLGSLTNIQQLKFDTGTGAGTAGAYYLDNVYFH